MYIDTMLPLGLRPAPKIFMAVADAAEWIIRQHGVDMVLHYLNDFLLIGAPNSDECKHALSTLLGIFSYLGSPVAEEKLEGPTVSLTFLGLQLDTMNMELRLPAERVSALHKLISSWLSRKSCTRSQLESVIGHLSHACKVVCCEKTFLRRLFELLAVARRADHYLRINVSVRSDFRWWDTFLSGRNGVALSQLFLALPATFAFATDASGAVGCGAIWPPIWL